MAGRTGQTRPLLWEPWSALRPWLYLHHLALPSLTQDWDPWFSFTSPPQFGSFLRVCAPLPYCDYIPCSFPWCGPLALAQCGLISKEICMLSPAPPYRFHSDSSALIRAILAHPYAKHCLEFYHQPRLSDRQKRMEGDGRMSQWLSAVPLWIKESWIWASFWKKTPFLWGDRQQHRIMAASGFGKEEVNVGLGRRWNAC